MRVWNVFINVHLMNTTNARIRIMKYVFPIRCNINNQSNCSCKSIDDERQHTSDKWKFIYLSWKPNNYHYLQWVIRCSQMYTAILITKNPLRILRIFLAHFIHFKPTYIIYKHLKLYRKFKSNLVHITGKMEII